MAELRNACAGPFGALYDFYIERERLAAVIGPLVWGISTRSMFESMSAIRAAPDGATILDVPCGGGVAFRALDPGQRVRYIAVDIADAMLARARRRAAEQKLDQVELLRAEIGALPLLDATVDLCVSYGGLHCVSRPRAALAELGRCLKPGGVLIGTTFLATGTRRQRALLGAAQRRGELGPLATARQLGDWLRGAGIAETVVEPDSGYVLFRGRKAA